MPPAKPRCKLEVVSPDDVLVIGINEVWFRTFTSNSDRYPVTVELPADLVRDWNVITAAYTNVALSGGKNEANVAYRVLLDDAEVVSVSYRAEAALNQTFTVNFKDSFHVNQRTLERGTSPAGARGSNRFQDLMKFQQGGAPPPAGPGGAPGR